VHGDAAVRVEDRMLAIDGGRCVGVADVAAGAIAGPPGTVVPAARVLLAVAAERPLIANLRRGDQRGSLREQPEALPHRGIVGHLGERRRRANFETTVGGLLHAAQCVDAAEIDDHFAALVAVLEPVKGVEAAGEYPRILLVLLEQRDGVVDGRRLKQLEHRHYIVDDGHWISLRSNSKFKIQSANTLGFVSFRVTSPRLSPVSAITGT